jgi:hypothetical protein
MARAEGRQAVELWMTSSEHTAFALYAKQLESPSTRKRRSQSFAGLAGERENKDPEKIRLAFSD